MYCWTGLWYSMEGRGQKIEGDGSGEKDLRRIQKSDGRAAYLSGDNVFAVFRQSREHNTTNWPAQGDQRSGHISRFRVHG